MTPLAPTGHVRIRRAARLVDDGSTNRTGRARICRLRREALHALRAGLADVDAMRRSRA